jgi:peptide chain release factor 2
LNQELAQVQADRELLEGLYRKYAEIDTILELIKDSPDRELAEEAWHNLEELEKQLEEVRTKRLLDGAHDADPALLTISSGAGGTDSQDWASMLLRMYWRWAEENGYQPSIVDYMPGEEAGVKHVLLLVQGPYAYGYLASENGVHRLVRLSPFDANHRRHTSFAAVSVIPEIDETIEVDIKPEDLRIDTYRSSGAGGQHVNVTDSAVRITHLPTGIVASCQNERSQHKNKAVAMQVLRSRLFQLLQAEKEEEMAEMKGEQKAVNFGSQIRSYILHPYKLVKDHRTELETSNVDRVLDGDINQFIRAYLSWRKIESK